MDRRNRYAGCAPAAGGAALVFSRPFFPLFFPSGSGGGWSNGPFCPQPAASTIQGRANAKRSTLRRPERPERPAGEDGEESAA